MRNKVTKLVCKINRMLLDFFLLKFTSFLFSPARAPTSYQKEENAYKQIEINVKYFIFVESIIFVMKIFDFIVVPVKEQPCVQNNNSNCIFTIQIKYLKAV
jgi:phosphate starvation-inducible membrane PsiE